MTFDPAVDDMATNKSMLEDANGADGQKVDASDPRTNEDIADEAALGENDMNACLIELNDYIFNFESLSK